MDGVVAGGASEYAAGGKCADRTTAADLSTMRNPSGETLKSYSMNVFPETVIENKKSEFTDTNMVALTEASDKYFLKLRFYKYERKELFKAANKDSFLYSVELPLPLEMIDVQRASYNTPDMRTVGNLLNNGFGEGTVTAGAFLSYL